MRSGTRAGIDPAAAACVERLLAKTRGNRKAVRAEFHAVGRGRGSGRLKSKREANGFQNRGFPLRVLADKNGHALPHLTLRGIKTAELADFERSEHFQ